MALHEFEWQQGDMWGVSVLSGELLLTATLLFHWCVNETDCSFFSSELKSILHGWRVCEQACLCVDTFMNVRVCECGCVWVCRRLSGPKQQFYWNTNTAALQNPEENNIAAGVFSRCWARWENFYLSVHACVCAGRSCPVCWYVQNTALSQLRWQMFILKFIILEYFKGALCSFGEEIQITAFKK